MIQDALPLLWVPPVPSIETGERVWYFFLPVVPYGKARSRSGKNGHYDNATETNRLAILDQAIAQADMPRLEDRDVMISWIALFPRNAALKKRNRDGSLKWGAGRLRHSKKPDRDNIDKAVLDSLQLQTRLDQDSRVSDGVLQKRWVGWDDDAGAWEPPGFHLWVADLGPVVG